MEDARTRRLAERIAKIVAELLERRIKDPRLGFVTVTEARLTGDLREAKVYYTVLGDTVEREESAAALRSATGIIRSEVGRLIGLRHTPSLEFIADALRRTRSGSTSWWRRFVSGTRSWPAPTRAPSGPATRIRTRSQPKTGPRTTTTGAPATRTTRTSDPGGHLALRPGHRR